LYSRRVLDAGSIAMKHFQLNFWIIILITAILQILFSISIVKIIAAPLNKILAALSHKIGELTTDTPPNPNDKRYEKTGFKTALQAIYGDYQPEQKPTSDNDKPKIPLTQALNQASTGVVILNSNQKIIFANSAAPISRNAKGEDFLALDFLNEPSIFDWLHEISNEKIKAEHRWQRISTNPDVIQKTRIFDIIVSFEKGATAETVIFLIDKSKGYLPEEEDLNFIGDFVKPIENAWFV
jgi:nitrogen fixation/metabolism regulation signal transduction histidine kinase